MSVGYVARRFRIKLLWAAGTRYVFEIRNACTMKAHFRHVTSVVLFTSLSHLPYPSHLVHVPLIVFTSIPSQTFVRPNLFTPQPQPPRLSKILPQYIVLPILPCLSSLVDRFFTASKYNRSDSVCLRRYKSRTMEARVIHVPVGPALVAVGKNIIKTGQSIYIDVPSTTTWKLVTDKASSAFGVICHGFDLGS